MQELIERYFKISHDASATLIITLSIFSLGYFFNGLANFITKYTNRKTNRKIFIENLKTLNNSLKLQEKGFINTISNLNNIKNPIWKFDKIDFFQINVFREISYKESFLSFFTGIENHLNYCVPKKLRRKSFTKTWGNISNVEFLSNHAFNDFPRLLEKYNKHCDNRNAAFETLRRSIDAILEFYTDKNPNDIKPDILEYVKGLDLIVIEFSKIPTYQRILPFVQQRKVVLPIKILNREFRQIPFMKEINDNAIQVSNNYIEMDSLVRNSIAQYTIYYYAIRTIRRTNKKIIDIIG